MYILETAFPADDLSFQLFEWLIKFLIKLLGQKEWLIILK